MPNFESRELTVLIPCLNEERSIGSVIEEVAAGLRQADLGERAEIVVVDNGSTDASAERARRAGARVVRETRRGYGRALRTGVGESLGRHVVFIDADGEHPPGLALILYLATLEAGAEVGLASRLTGHIADGAMPFSHRYFGTPALTCLINLWFKGALTDCMSGLRCVRRDWFLGQEFHQDGMAFASELLIRALRSGAEVMEIPGGMRRGPKGRRSHLHTWRDGWRHLRLICMARFEEEGGKVSAPSYAAKAAFGEFPLTGGGGGRGV